MTNGAIFRTQDLPFAAYLHATKNLTFLGCEFVHGSHHVLAFTFSDPNDEGPGLQIAFEGGAPVPAVAYFDTIRRLRRFMTEFQNQHTSIGAVNDDRPHQR